MMQKFLLQCSWQEIIYTLVHVQCRRMRHCYWVKICLAETAIYWQFLELLNQFCHSLNYFSWFLEIHYNNNSKHVLSTYFVLGIRLGISYEQSYLFSNYKCKFWSQTIWVRILALTFNSYMTLENSFNFSVLQFLNYKIGIIMIMPT